MGRGALLSAEEKRRQARLCLPPFCAGAEQAGVDFFLFFTSAGAFMIRDFRRVLYPGLVKCGAKSGIKTVKPTTGPEGSWPGHEGTFIKS